MSSDAQSSCPTAVKTHPAPSARGAKAEKFRHVETLTHPPLCALDLPTSLRLLMLCHLPAHSLSHSHYEVTVPGLSSKYHLLQEHFPSTSKAKSCPIPLVIPPIFSASLGFCTVQLAGGPLVSLAHLSDCSQYTEDLFIFTPSCLAYASALSLPPLPVASSLIDFSCRALIQPQNLS